jgi:NAD(P)-dependent dehydrogenase (short-subunit alcohol dehydrogenase family)
MKKAIITGSSHGIGLATAKQILQTENMQVIGTSTSGNHSLKSKNFKCLALDLSDEQSIDIFYKKVQSLPIDYLINNAGILPGKWNESSINFDHLRSTFEVNVFGTIHLTEKLLPQMKPNGHIINVSSGWGTFSDENFDQYVPHYKLSKATLNMYTKLLAERLKPQNIKVSAINPGWVKTDMGSNSAARYPEESAKEIVQLMLGDVETGNFWYKGQIRSW